MKCQHCKNDMIFVKMEMSNSTIADPKFHHFHQCFHCGWADKKWVSVKYDLALKASAVPWNEDYYDDWKNGVALRSY